VNDLLDWVTMPSSVRVHVRLLALSLAAVALLAACAPALEAFNTPAAQEVEKTAWEAFHRMELGRLRLGVYTTNVLVDLVPPRGTRLTVEAYSDDSYRLRVSSDAAPEVAWLVTPRGVQRIRT